MADTWPLYDLPARGWVRLDEYEKVCGQRDRAEDRLEQAEVKNDELHAALERFLRGSSRPAPATGKGEA